MIHITIFATNNRHCTVLNYPKGWSSNWVQDLKPLLDKMLEVADASHGTDFLFHFKPYKLSIILLLGSSCWSAWFKLLQKSPLLLDPCLLQRHFTNFIILYHVGGKTVSKVDTKLIIWEAAIFFDSALLCSLSLSGIAFPTCVSVNNCVCHYSPLKSDPDVILKDGDLVKM